MKDTKDVIILREKLEALREKLNDHVIKYMERPSIEKYKKLVALSEKLDCVIVDYIKIFNK